MTKYLHMRQTAGLAPASTIEEAAAEELVYLIHEGIDWTVWGGKRLKRYWDALTERVRAATYAGPSLDLWWDDVSLRMSSQPASHASRMRLVEIMGESDSTEVLKILRSKGSVLILRVRVVLENNRESTEGKTV